MFETHALFSVSEPGAETKEDKEDCSRARFKRLIHTNLVRSFTKIQKHQKVLASVFLAKVI